MALSDDEVSSSNIMEIIDENDDGNGPPFFALIVDDDPFLLYLYSAMLKSVGITCETARNGQEAIDIFRTGAIFDFVFMDLEMPIMNGIEATKELRSMGVTCKIVGVTTFYNDDAKTKAFREAGINSLHEKPLTLAIIRSCLEG